MDHGARRRGIVSRRRPRESSHRLLTYVLRQLHATGFEHSGARASRWRLHSGPERRARPGVEPATASPLIVFATLFALLAIVAAYAILHDTGIVYYLAAFFTIAAEAMWSANYLTPERLHGALAIYGIFAVFFVGVPILARRFGRDLSPRNAVAVNATGIALTGVPRVS